MISLSLGLSQVSEYKILQCMLQNTIGGKKHSTLEYLVVLALDPWKGH